MVTMFPSALQLLPECFRAPIHKPHTLTDGKRAGWGMETNSTNLHELPGKWIDRDFCGWFDSGVRDEEIVKVGRLRGRE